MSRVRATTPPKSRGADEDVAFVVEDSPPFGEQAQREIHPRVDSTTKNGCEDKFNAIADAKNERVHLDGESPIFHRSMAKQEWNAVFLLLRRRKASLTNAMASTRACFRIQYF